jgi:DNA-directed RNA polymerase subunit beta
VEECKEKDMTYAAPLFVTAEFINNNTGEIKSQTVFMGDFPMMTEKGTFIINGTERVVVSQLVRSPGRLLRAHGRQDVRQGHLHSVKVIPSRGAWLEFEIDKRDMVGVRLDRKRKQNVTVLLKALGWTNEQIRGSSGFSESMMLTLEKDNTADHRRGAARHLPQAASGRAAHQGGRPDPAGELLLQGEALRPGQGRPLQGEQEARPACRPAVRPARR